jgi:hypothetical protein
MNVEMCEGHFSPAPGSTVICKCSLNYYFAISSKPLRPVAPSNRTQRRPAYIFPACAFLLLWIFIRRFQLNSRIGAGALRSFVVPRVAVARSHMLGPVTLYIQQVPSGFTGFNLGDLYM